MVQSRHFQKNDIDLLENVAPGKTMKKQATYCLKK